MEAELPQEIQEKLRALAQEAALYIKAGEGPLGHLEIALSKAAYFAIDHERDRCCQLVFGHASSDNVAQRTVDAIRGKTKRN